MNDSISNPSIEELSTMFSGEGGGSRFVSRLLSVGVTILLIAGSLYFVFMLLTGAVSWIGSGGDKAQLEEARTKLFNAGIGLVLLFSAWAVFTLIENIFGVDLLLLDIPTLVDTS